MEAPQPVKPLSIGKKIDFLASEDHFLSHLAPVWQELPSRLRGSFYTRPEFFSHAMSYGIQPKDIPDMEGNNITYVAAFGDMKKARQAGRYTVITEHGVGQSYLGVKSGSYLGAIDRAGCLAVFVPAPYQAAMHLRRHPAIPVYPIGCPKLDKRWKDPGKPEKNLVCISTHWDCKVAPETRSSIRHFRRALPELAKNFKMIGHAHPRFARQMETIYAKYKIEWVPDFEEVMDRASLYIMDNSSTLYEFASLDRPVVVLNSPDYRRDVHHGLRFWDMADVGLQANEAKELPGIVKRALSDPPEVAKRRREVISTLYGQRDGLDAQRAAAALSAIHKQWK